MKTVLPCQTLFLSIIHYFYFSWLWTFCVSVSAFVTAAYFFCRHSEKIGNLRRILFIIKYWFIMIPSHSLVNELVLFSLQPVIINFGFNASWIGYFLNRSKIGDADPYHFKRNWKDPDLILDIYNDPEPNPWYGIK